jgi:hypothetical protein
MGLVKKITTTVFSLLLAVNAYAVAGSDSSSDATDQFEPVKTKILSTAMHNFQVKRLKKMLDKRQISSEQFFSKIEGIIGSEKSKR